MTKRVLLVDTNYSSAPIYDFLVQSECEVFVIGGNAGDYLAKSVKNYVHADYSNVDRARQVIEELKIDFIVPGCNDRSYEVCAELNLQGKYSGLDTLEATKLLNKKNEFRAFADQIGLPVPKVIDLENMDEKGPVIVKPVDAYSGRGMTIVEENSLHDLEWAVRHAREFSRSNTVIIEEYVEGQLYSHSAFILNGQVVTDFIVEEHGTANPFVVDTSRVVYDFPRDTLNDIRECISFMAKKLNLVDGLVHTQFIKKGTSFWLIEITRRCPGDLYSQLVELSTGFPYAQAYTMPFIRNKYSYDKNTSHQSRVIRHTISGPDEGVLGSIKFNYPALIEKIVPLSLAGDTIKASPFGRIALIFLRCKTEDELLDMFKKTLERKLYTIQHAH